MAALLAAGLVVGCVSPEATRQAGSGPGADPGNRGPSVELHGRSDPFYRTPLAGQGVRAARGERQQAGRSEAQR